MRKIRPLLRRLLSAATVAASLLFLAQVPTFQASPVSTEEEQHRVDPVERAPHILVAARPRRHVSYQETIEAAPTYVTQRTIHSFRYTSNILPRTFAGSSPPLRC